MKVSLTIALCCCTAAVSFAGTHYVVTITPMPTPQTNAIRWAGDVATLRCVLVTNDTVVMETPLQKVETNGTDWVLATTENVRTTVDGQNANAWRMELTGHTNATVTATHRFGQDRYEVKVSGTFKITEESIDLFLERAMPTTGRYWTREALLNAWPDASMIPTNTGKRTARKTEANPVQEDTSRSRADPQH
jgi:hypothetical protein